MTRCLSAMLLLASLAASAQTRIGGALSARFASFNEFGVPSVQVDFALTCSLSCDAAAPTLHYKIRGGTRSYFTSKPEESSGYSLTPVDDLDPDGQATVTSEAIHAGTVNFIEAKSVTCECGNRLGEGGYIDLNTGTFVIPPWVQLSDSKAGNENTAFINADLRGSESVEVTLSGVLTETLTLTAADFDRRTYVLVRSPTKAGTLSVTATLNGVSRTSTATITPADSQATGGGTGNTGGGAGTDGGAGCAVGLGALLPLVTLLARRRAR